MNFPENFSEFPFEEFSGLPWVGLQDKTWKKFLPWGRGGGINLTSARHSPFPPPVVETWENLKKYVENMKEFEEIYGKYEGICGKYQEKYIEKYLIIYLFSSCLFWEVVPTTAREPITADTTLIKKKKKKLNIKNWILSWIINLYVLECMKKKLKNIGKLKTFWIHSILIKFSIHIYSSHPYPPYSQ